jgi:aminoglycoside phosphotransferase (APT) family kinase protein
MGGPMVRAHVDPGTGAALRGALLRAVESEGGALSAVRAPCRFSTLYPAEVVTVRLNSGATRRFFVKHLGDEQADHPDKQCRDREVRVYAELLRERHLPVPRVYGWDRSPVSGRRELVLEYVDDLPLRHQDLANWIVAARALGRLHRWFGGRRERLRSCDFLLRIDTGYANGWYRRAVVAVQGLNPELGMRLKTSVMGAAWAADLLARAPATLVHNDLSPKNIIVERSSRPARVYLLDWELAGIGCAALDIVHLCHGLERDEAQRVWSAYREELAGTDMMPRPASQQGSMLAACKLHKTLYRLAHAGGWSLPLETLEEWVADVERLAASRDTGGVIG